MKPLSIALLLILVLPFALPIGSSSGAAALPQAPHKDLYPAGVDAKKEIDEALHSASPAHKRVLVVFGANWCGDCHALDDAFHSAEISPTLNKYFVVVHVDIGRGEKNADLAQKYDIPLNRGIPAIAVLDSSGKLLFSQKNGEFEAARSLTNADILVFLNKWKPAST
jgi:thioredoxin 1